MIGPPTADVLSCLAIASLEEDAVVLGAELREVRVRRRWIGFEMEAVSSFLRRCDGDSDGRRTLEEVAPEFVRRVAESDYVTCDAAPLDSH
jgi:hypothetical protein